METTCKLLRFSHVLPTLVHKNLDYSFKIKEDWSIYLLEKKLAYRGELKTARLLRRVKFPNRRTLESYEWHNHICLPNATTKDELLSLSFIHQKEDAVFVGTPGIGETRLACGLGQLATESGTDTRFRQVSDLVNELEHHWKNNTLEVFKRRFDKVKLVIPDGMDCVSFTREDAELLFQLTSNWYETKSIIVTSNLEFSKWNKVFVDARLTVALVDCLIHHAHTLSFTDESFRLKNALSKSN